MLLRIGRALFYAEAIVLSARYEQWLANNQWSSGARRYSNRLSLWMEQAEPRLREPRVVLEFGVADGDATHWWASRKLPFAEWHGFDTFEGLPAAWTRAGISVMEAGRFAPTEGKYPQPAASYPHSWHKGLIEETLPAFARPNAPLFVLIDVDLLQPAEHIFNWLRANGRAGDLVYLDEALDPWNEGLALRHALDAGLSLRALGYTANALLAQLA
jgi:hypothetical protein